MEDNQQEKWKKELDEIWQNNFEKDINESFGKLNDKMNIKFNEITSMLTGNSDYKKYKNELIEKNKEIKYNLIAKITSLEDNFNDIIDPILFILGSIEDLTKFAFIRYEKEKSENNNLNIEAKFFSSFIKLLVDMKKNNDKSIETNDIHDCLKKLIGKDYDNKSPGQNPGLIIKTILNLLNKKQIEENNNDNNTLISKLFSINLKAVDDSSNNKNELLLNLPVPQDRNFTMIGGNMMGENGYEELILEKASIESILEYSENQKYRIESSNKIIILNIT